MMSDTNARRYSTGAMVFHWVIAVLVIANWQIAERAEALDMPAKIEMFGYHKAVGIMILVLTLGRLLWRFTHPVPPLPATISGW
ncbi:MAG TPA: cytochrome B, partial [Erythrobacter sp.]|nr:cytochrome B [Erythrobacter sp.]